MKYYHLEQLSDVFKKMGKSAIKIQKGLYNHIANMFNIIFTEFNILDTNTFICQ